MGGNCLIWSHYMLYKEGQRVLIESFEGGFIKKATIKQDLGHSVIVVLDGEKKMRIFGSSAVIEVLSI